MKDRTVLEIEEKLLEMSTNEIVKHLGNLLYREQECGENHIQEISIIKKILFCRELGDLTNSQAITMAEAFWESKYPVKPHTLPMTDSSVTRH